MRPTRLSDFLVSAFPQHQEPPEDAINETPLFDQSSVHTAEEPQPTLDVRLEDSLIKLEFNFKPKPLQTYSY